MFSFCLFMMRRIGHYLDLRSRVRVTLFTFDSVDARLPARSHFMATGALFLVTFSFVLFLASPHNTLLTAYRTLHFYFRELLSFVYCVRVWLVTHFPARLIT